MNLKFVLDPDKHSSHQKLKNDLKKNKAGYVLITCSEPSSEGNMEIEMSYDGDEVLASYLIDSAQEFFDTNVVKTQDLC